MNRRQAPSVSWPRKRSQRGITLIDTILTLVLLATAAAVVLPFFTGIFGIEQPVQRLQRGKDFQLATESILADYLNNYLQPWNATPPAGFDVCDDAPTNTYNATDGNCTVGSTAPECNLRSPLILFLEEFTNATPGTDYGNYTIVETVCGRVRNADAVDGDMQQLRITLRPLNSTAQTSERLVLVLGK